MGTAGILRLESEPPGATVRENGVEICVATPCDVPWTATKKGAPARQLFFFKAGFRPEMRPVTEASKPVVVHLSRLSTPVRPPPKEQPSAGPPGYKVDIPY
jgi:hypothetical protein